MPEMGGGECLREILKIDPAAKVLIAGGYEAGQLLEAVRQVLDENRFERSLRE